MPALGQRTPPHIRALDKTLIGEGCWEYGGKIGNRGYGLVYNGSGCRFTDLLITVVYAGSPGSTEGQPGPATSHSSARSAGLSSIHSGNDRSISMRASASSIPPTVTPTTP